MFLGPSQGPRRAESLRVGVGGVQSRTFGLGVSKQRMRKGKLEPTSDTRKKHC